MRAERGVVRPKTAQMVKIFHENRTGGAGRLVCPYIQYIL